jgi:hypothetical protein
MFFQNFIWAHFLLRKKPGFPGLRRILSVEASAANSRSKSVGFATPCAASTPDKSGVNIIPMVELSTDTNYGGFADYYVVTALVISFIIFRVSSLFFEEA